jgi:DNA-binding NtrC family response regulator
MEKKYADLNLHQKLEIVIREMVDSDLNLKDGLNEFEKIFFDIAAKKFNGNQTKMAKALGIHRNTLHNRTRSQKIRRKS